MKLKMFTCICDIGDEFEPVRITGVATSMKDFKERYKGNGDLLKIKEVETALSNESFMGSFYGKNEIDLMIAIMEENNK